MKQKLPDLPIFPNPWKENIKTRILIIHQKQLLLFLFMVFSTSSEMQMSIM